MTSPMDTPEGLLAKALTEIAEACEKATHPAAEICLSESHLSSLQQISAKARGALRHVAQSSRDAALEEAAQIAERGCLVPPDGGSPTEEEREMCESIASAIRVRKLFPRPGTPLPSTQSASTDIAKELDAAKAFLREKPSTSYLQRKMSITYNHAMRLMETLENEGFISQPDSAGRRSVLVSQSAPSSSLPARGAEETLERARELAERIVSMARQRDETCELKFDESEVLESAIEDIAEALRSPAPHAEVREQWLRWGLEEIVRCTEPRAGSGDGMICRIATDALVSAGLPLDAAGIQKPKSTLAPHSLERGNPA